MKKEILRAYKFRIYPDAEQKEQLAQTFGSSRYVFNWALNLKDQSYKAGVKLNAGQISAALTQLKNKKDDLILDMHNHLSYYLVSNYDVIFLPSFESKKMVKRQGKTRTIRRNTARQILDLNHYSFKLRLKWYAKKYGKIVVDVDESYTSKTRSWDGTIDEKLGSSKIIKTDKFSVGRDINGARNILIKHLKAA